MNYVALILLSIAAVSTLGGLVGVLAGVPWLMTWGSGASVKIVTAFTLLCLTAQQWCWLRRLEKPTLACAGLACVSIALFSLQPETIGVTPSPATAGACLALILATISPPHRPLSLWLVGFLIGPALLGHVVGVPWMYWAIEGWSNGMALPTAAALGCLLGTCFLRRGA